MPDSHRPSIFNPPEEPPLGYDAIVAWLRKPRPLLSRAFGWVRLLLAKLYDAGVFIKKNARRGAEWVQRAAERAKPVVRAGAEIGEGVRNVGRRMSAAAGAFRDPEGKHLGTERKVRRAGDTTRVYGERITAGSEIAGAVFSLLSAIGGPFKPQQPASIDPRALEEAPEDAGEAPGSDGRILPRKPDKRPAESAGSRTERVPKPHGPSADPESGGEAEETPADTPREPPAGDAEEEPSEHPHQRPALGRAEEKPPELPHERPTPADAEQDDGRTSTAETPEPDPEAASESPARPERQPPPPAPPAPPEDRFEGVPRVMLPRVKAPLERPSREVLHPLILDLCLLREWTTARQMARWFSMHRRSLVARHLGPLVDEELLMLRFPNKVRSRKQAYRTNPDRWPPYR